jgi:hypothetical protein
LAYASKVTVCNVVGTELFVLAVILVKLQRAMMRSLLTMTQDGSGVVLVNVSPKEGGMSSMPVAESEEGELE